MKKSFLNNELNALAETQAEIINLLGNHFFAGNIEHQIGLIGNSIQEVLLKGTNDKDTSMDEPFTYTNRYIRESVYDLVELQKFLIRLHIVYGDYKQRYQKLTEQTA